MIDSESYERLSDKLDREIAANMAEMKDASIARILQLALQNEGYRAVQVWLAEELCKDEEKDAEQTTD